MLATIPEQFWHLVHVVDDHWHWSGPRDALGVPTHHVASRVNPAAALIPTPAARRLFEIAMGHTDGWQTHGSCGDPLCVAPEHQVLRPRLAIQQRRLARSDVDTPERCFLEDALILLAYSPVPVRELVADFGFSELLCQVLRRERHTTLDVVNLYWRSDESGRTVSTGFAGGWYGQLGPVPISDRLARRLEVAGLDDLPWLDDAKRSPPPWLAHVAYSFEVPFLAVWRLWVEARATWADPSYLQTATLNFGELNVRLDVARGPYEAYLSRRDGARHVRRALMGR